MKRLLLVLLLAGCTANGPEYVSDSHNLIIYRPERVFFFARSYPVDVNGSQLCGLKNGGFTETDANGDVLLSASLWDEPGTSRVRIPVEPNKKYYVKIDINDNKQWAIGMAGAAAGVVGTLTADAATYGGGQFVFTLVDEKQALSDLKGLHRQCQQ